MSFSPRPAPMRMCSSSIATGLLGSSGTEKDSAPFVACSCPSASVIVTPPAVCAKLDDTAVSDCSFASSAFVFSSRAFSLASMSAKLSGVP